MVKIWNYGLRSIIFFVRGFSWNFVVSYSWNIDSKVDEKFLTGSWLIWGKSLSKDQHSLELSIISVVRFVISGFKVQIGSSLVYITMKIELLSAPRMFCLEPLPAIQAVNNINPAHPAKYIADLLYTLNELWTLFNYVEA